MAKEARASPLKDFWSADVGNVVLGVKGVVCREWTYRRCKNSGVGCYRGFLSHLPDTEPEGEKPSSRIVVLCGNRKVASRSKDAL